MPAIDRYKLLKKLLFVIILILTIYIILPFLFEYYKKNGARKLVEKFSPKGRYKVEYYIPLEYKYILFPVDSPFFVKVYDFKEKRYIYESDFHEMGQGTYVSWPIRGVQKIYVGTNIGTHDLELEE
jgi:hypothetical protein